MLPFLKIILLKGSCYNFMGFLNKFKSRSALNKVGSIIGIIIFCINIYAFFKIKETLFDEGLFIFYLPACLAFIAALENKQYLMLLASLLYLPIFFLDIFSFMHVVLLFLYLLSVSLIGTKVELHKT